MAAGVPPTVTTTVPLPAGAPAVAGGVGHALGGRMSSPLAARASTVLVVGRPEAAARWRRGGWWAVRRRRSTGGWCRRRLHSPAWRPAFNDVRAARSRAAAGRRTRARGRATVTRLTASTWLHLRPRPAAPAVITAAVTTPGDGLGPDCAADRADPARRAAAADRGRRPSDRARGAGRRHLRCPRRRPRRGACRPLRRSRAWRR